MNPLGETICGQAAPLRYQGFWGQCLVQEHFNMWPGIKGKPGSNHQP